MPSSKEYLDFILDCLSDLDNICFMGTNVISGSAKGVVIKTGDATYFGKVADTITDELRKSIGSDYFKVSALTGENVEESFMHAAKLGLAFYREQQSISLQNTLVYQKIMFKLF